MIDAEGSRLLADVFNTLTEGQENIMPEDVAERIEVNESVPSRKGQFVFAVQAVRL